MYMSVLPGGMFVCHNEPEDCVVTFDTRVRDSWEPLCGGWKSNWCHLGKQPVILPLSYLSSPIS